MVTLDCCNCGLTFAIPALYEKRRREDHGWFYCPSGHQQHYTAETQLERKKREAEQAAVKWRNYAEGQERRYEAEKRSHAATKGKLTRLEKGVCPVGTCRRNFVNLARHMATKHPEYVEGQ